jgi:Mn-dependent DtxR family transcriptional regulator
VVYNREVVTNFFHKVLGLDPESAEIDACKIEHLLSHEASEKLLGLVQLLSQDEPVVASFLKKFNSFKVTCPEHENCDVCEDVCLEGQ